MRLVKKFVVLLSCILTTSCVNNTLNHLGDNLPEASSYSLKQGEIASAILQASRPTLRDPVIIDYLYTIKTRLLATPKTSPHRGSFYLLDDDQEYAFTLTNGDIFLSSGLLKLAQNESELASVIAHELSHILLGHLNTIEDRRTAGYQGSSPAELNKAFKTVMHHGKSREDELAADRIMVLLHNTAGYEPCGVQRIFKKLFAITYESDPDSLSTQLFDTHPAFPERLTEIEKLTDQNCEISESVLTGNYQSKILDRL